MLDRKILSKVGVTSVEPTLVGALIACADGSRFEVSDLGEFEDFCRFCVVLSSLLKTRYDDVSMAVDQGLMWTRMSMTCLSDGALAVPLEVCPYPTLAATDGPRVIFEGLFGSVNRMAVMSADVDDVFECICGWMRDRDPC